MKKVVLLAVSGLLLWLGIFAWNPGAMVRHTQIVTGISEAIRKAEGRRQEMTEDSLAPKKRSRRGDVTYGD